MRQGGYFTYIIASRSRTLYIGITNNLVLRVHQHKHHLRDGFTAKYHCHRLVWFERFEGPTRAIAREKQLKGWTRAKKIALIEKSNPTWEDLSAATIQPPLPSPPRVILSDQRESKDLLLSPPTKIAPRHPK